MFELDDLARARHELDRLAAATAHLRDENERLRQAETHFRELFDATYDGIFVVDLEEGRILEANEPACRLVGYPRTRPGPRR